MGMDGKKDVALSPRLVGCDGPKGSLTDTVEPETDSQVRYHRWLGNWFLPIRRPHEKKILSSSESSRHSALFLFFGCSRPHLPGGLE